MCAPSNRKIPPSTRLPLTLQLLQEANIAKSQPVDIFRLYRDLTISTAGEEEQGSAEHEQDLNRFLGRSENQARVDEEGEEEEGGRDGSESGIGDVDVDLDMDVDVEMGEWMQEPRDYGESSDEMHPLNESEGRREQATTPAQAERGDEGHDRMRRILAAGEQQLREELEFDRRSMLPLDERRRREGGGTWFERRRRMNG